MAVEVDENELAALRRVTGFVNSALANPETRQTILMAQRKLNPNVPIPELDAAKPVQDALAELRNEMKADREAREAEKREREAASVEAKARQQWNQGRKSLHKAGWNDEGVKVIEEFMEKRGIADHEVAAAAYEKMHPAPEAPVGGGPNRFDLFGSKAKNGEALKPLFEGRDDEFLGTMIQQTLADVRGTAR